MTKKIFILLILASQICISNVHAQSGLCDPSVPFFQVNLVGSPNGTWVSAPPVIRQGLCCGNTSPDRCIEFELTLDPATVAINFQIASGAIPTGSMYYQLNCSPPTPVGQPICLTGTGPYTLTFCKPGANLNTYEITTYSTPYLDPDTYTTDGCQIGLNAHGVDSTTITWTDITGGGMYNSFLSCTNCASPNFNPTTPYPAYIDYKVCAMPIFSVCSSVPLWCDTIRVTLIPKLAVSVGPSAPSYCANQSGVMLTANATGGAQPFNYIWTNSSGIVVGNSSTYFATNPGTYTIEVRDTLYNQCGSQSSSINVIMNPLPNVSVVAQNPAICIGSSVNITASGGSSYLWSTGANTSTISVSPTTTTPYYVTVTNSNGCSATGSATVTVNSLPEPFAGTDQTICNGQSAILTVSGGSTYQWSNGATTPSINVTPSQTTTYIVTATSNGCTATDNITVNVNPVPSVNAGPDQTICQGQSVSITATGGTSYQWSNGANTASIVVNPSSSTNYIVTATNALGCTAFDNVNVNVNPKPIANAGNDQTICEGQTASLTASGGSSYLWSTGTGTSTIIVSPSSLTTYTVTVIGSNGCSASDNVVVYVDAAPVANAGPDLMLCAGQSISITATGGSVFQWSTGSAFATINVSPVVTTTYTVTVTSGNGCAATDDVLVTVNPTPIAFAGNDVTICLGQTTTLTAGGGSSYQWSTGENTTAINVSPASNTVYTVTATNAYGCTASDAVTVNINPLPPADAGVDQMICQGQSTTLIASGGGTYSWSTGAVTSSINVAPATTSTYTLTVTGINGCSATDLTTVYVNAPPVANAGPDQTICLGQTASLQATGGASYQWSTGASSSSISVSPSATTTYLVTVSSGNGCSATDNVTVNVNSLPVAYAGADQTICSGNSTILTASGGSTYQWSSGSTTPSTSVTPTITTNYIVTVTSNNGCTSSDNVVVNVIPLPTPYAGNDQTICQGQSATLTAIGGTSYQWSNGSTNSSINVTPSSTTTYSVTVTGNSGCTASDNVTVNVDPFPAAYAGADQTVCLGQFVSLSASGGLIYSWNNGDNNATTTVSPLTTTTYDVTVTSINGCSASDEVVVTVNPLPIAYAGADKTICLGQSVSFFASGGSSYQWNTGANTSSLIVSPSSTTTYTVTVTGANGCTASDNVVAYVNPLPIANAGNDQTICQGQTATLIASGGGSYLWNNGAITPSINIAPSSTTTYTVSVTNSNGCVASDNAIIIVNPLPFANAGNDQNVCPNQLTTLTASGGTSYVWNTGNTNSTINVTPTQTTTYSVTVTSLGCQSTDEVTLFINPLAVANAGPDHTICPGESANIIATTAGSYSWSNGMTTQNISVSPSVTTTYTLTVSSGGCSSTDEVIVNVAALISVDAGTDTSICSDQYVTLTATGGSNYLWSNGMSSNSINVSPSSTTTYTVTTTSGSCSATDDVVVTVNTNPVANAGPDQSMCAGSSTILSATGGTSYLWDNGYSSSSQVVSPAASTNYSVTVTNASGCTATDIVNVIVNSIPPASAGPDKSICQGQSVMLNATGGTSYSWSNGQTTASISVTPASTTTYSVTVVSANGCSAYDNTVVNVMSLPVANAGTDQTICLGDVATLTASLGASYQWSNGASAATIFVSPIAPFTTYTVTVTSSSGCTAVDSVSVNVNSLPVANAGADKYICQGQTTTVTATGGNAYLWSNGLSSASFTVTPYVTTTFTVTVSNVSGCTAIDDITINVNSLPTANAGADQTICAGQTATLTASGGSTYLWNTGANLSTLNVAPLSTTNYTVTVTSANGCTASDNVTIIVNPIPVVNAGADQSICQGSSTTLTASAGSTYNWSTGQTSGSINITPLFTTTYTVTVFSSTGCSSSDNVVVNVNPLPIANAGPDKSVCYGSSTLLIASGGNAYLWSNGQTNDSIYVTPNATSNYSVIVTNSNGCSASDNVSVYVNALPLADAGLDKILCEGESVVLTATGGTNYLWNNGSTNATINVTPASTTLYTVTVSNTNGCSASDNVFVFVNALPTVNAGTDQIICQGQTATLAATGGLSYQWNTGATTASINVAPSLTTTYQVTVTNSSGCIATDDVTVNVNAIPLASAGTDQTICQGETVTITASGGSNFQWSTGSTSASINVTPASTTNYTVTVTNSNGCFASDDITIIVNNTPNAYAGLDQTICFGQSVNLLATGGGSYQWSTGTSASSITVSPQVNTTYNVTVTNVNGCTASDDVLINVNSLPVANAGADKTICQGQSANLIASGGMSYLWNTGANTSTIWVSPSSTTTYSITVTNLNGCTASDNVVINVNSLPVAYAGIDQTICEGQTPTLNATGGGSYIWNTGATTSSINVTPSSNTTYSVTVTNLSGCSASDEVAIFVNTAPSANAGSDQTICYGQSVTFTVNGGTSQMWSTGNATSSITVIPLVTTTYTVTVTNSSGCTSSDDVAVIVNPTPVADAGIDQVICQGQSVVLTANGGNSYLWNNGTSSNSITVIPASTSTYTVTVSNSFGCTASDDVSLYVNPVPIANAGNNQTICPGETATLVASGGSNYMWNTGVFLSTLNISPLITTNYYVTVTSSNGCSASDDVLVTVNSGVSAFAGNDVYLCPGASANLQASGGIIYNWSPPIGLSSTVIANPVAIPANTTTYIVTVTNGQGCSDADSVTVFVASNPIITVTPNSPAICIGGSTQLTASGCNTYYWSPSNGLSASTGASVTASPISTTTYTVTGTDINGCSASTSVVVTVGTGLPITVTPNSASICPGSSVQLSATGATNYSWSPNSGLSSVVGSTVIASPTISTTYTVVGSDTYGCSGSTTVIVDVNIVSATVSSTNEFCGQANGTLTVTPSGTCSQGYTYSWDTNPPMTTQTVTNVSAGIYTVIVYCGGCSDTATVSIDNVPGPSVTITDVINTSCGQANGTATVNVSGGTSPYNYLWSDGQNTQVLTNASGGTYTVTVTDDAGCNVDTMISIAPSLELIATTSSTNADCNVANGSATVAVTQGLGTYTYLWSTNPIQTTPSVTGIPAGAYTVTVNDSLCTIISSVAVQSNPGPDAYFTANPTAITIDDGLVYFTDHSTSNVVTWQWDFGDGSPMATGLNPTHIFDSIGTFTVTLVVNDANGCQDIYVDDIIVNEVFNYFIPNAFTPNDDGTNDVWLPQGLNVDPNHFALFIYDRWGNLVFETNDPEEGWNGTYMNKGEFTKALMDVYVYKIIFKDKEDHRHEYVGHITLVH